MNRAINHFAVFLALSACAAVGFAQLAHSRQSEKPFSKEVPCAAIRSIEGDVEALTPDRNALISLDGRDLPCGAWVTVRQGSIELVHRQGFSIKAAPGAFFEVFDNENGKHLSGPDHIVLYRGKIHVRAQNGMGELRVATPNARARIGDDTGVVIYNQSLEETQLISLSKASVLENRFLAMARTVVKAGESTRLSLSAMRVTPSTPLAVKIAAIKEVLNGFPIDGQELALAASVVKSRLERAFPTQLESEPARAVAAVSRKPASTDSKTYVRHKNLPGDAKAHARWVSKLVGGAPGAERILFPNEKPQATRKPAQVSVEVLKDPGIEFDRKEQERINKERDRLMRELAKLRDI